MKYCFVIWVWDTEEETTGIARVGNLLRMESKTQCYGGSFTKRIPVLEYFKTKPIGMRTTVSAAIETLGCLTPFYILWG